MLAKVAHGFSFRENMQTLHKNAVMFLWSDSNPEQKQLTIELTFKNINQILIYTQVKESLCEQQRAKSDLIMIPTCCIQLKYYFMLNEV